jgi:hypothetical protein
MMSCEVKAWWQGSRHVRTAPIGGTTESERPSATTVQFFPFSSIYHRLIFIAPPPSYDPRPLAQDNFERIEAVLALAAT